jgi:hypothetical protein
MQMSRGFLDETAPPDSRIRGGGVQHRKTPGAIGRTTSRMSNTNLNEPRITVRIGESDFGFPQPFVEVRAPAGMRYRVLNATLHTIAARIELAMPARCPWAVSIQHGRSNECGYVVIELHDGTTDEAEAGLAILKELFEP